MAQINYRLRPAVWGLRTARMLVTLSPGQTFCENPKSWAIWQKETPHVVKRIPKSRIFFVYVKDGWGWCSSCQKDVEVDGRLDASGIYDICQHCGERIEESLTIEEMALAQRMKLRFGKED